MKPSPNVRHGDRVPRSFFSRDTLEVARSLLGKRLICVQDNGTRTGGRILEAEAYVGTIDLGCHARSGKTQRNGSMWGPPGHAYVYFTYGMHWMLNFVTEAEGRPAAVLIRSIQPEEGERVIRRRRKDRPRREWTNGPAKICRALGIGKAFDGIDLCSADSRLFVEFAADISAHAVQTGPRVGLFTVPEPWKSIPWRFHIKPEDLP